MKRTKWTRVVVLLVASLMLCAFAPMAWGGILEVVENQFVTGTNNTPVENNHSKATTLYYMGTPDAVKVGVVLAGTALGTGTEDVAVTAPEGWSVSPASVRLTDGDLVQTTLVLTSSSVPNDSLDLPITFTAASGTQSLLSLGVLAKKIEIVPCYKEAALSAPFEQVSFAAYDTAIVEKPQIYIRDKTDATLALSTEGDVFFYKGELPGAVRILNGQMVCNVSNSRSGIKASIDASNIFKLVTDNSGALASQLVVVALAQTATLTVANGTFAIPVAGGPSTTGGAVELTRFTVVVSDPGLTFDCGTQKYFSLWHTAVLSDDIVVSADAWPSGMALSALLFLPPDSTPDQYTGSGSATETIGGMTVTASTTSGSGKLSFSERATSAESKRFRIAGYAEALTAHDPSKVIAWADLTITVRSGGATSLTIEPSILTFDEGSVVTRRVSVTSHDRYEVLKADALAVAPSGSRNYHGKIEYNGLTISADVDSTLYVSGFPMSAGEQNFTVSADFKSHGMSIQGDLKIKINQLSSTRYIMQPENNSAYKMVVGQYFSATDKFRIYDTEAGAFVDLALTDIRFGAATIPGITIAGDPQNRTYTISGTPTESGFWEISYMATSPSGEVNMWYDWPIEVEASSKYINITPFTYYLPSNRAVDFRIPIETAPGSFSLANGYKMSFLERDTTPETKYEAPHNYNGVTFDVDTVTEELVVSGTSSRTQSNTKYRLYAEKDGESLTTGFRLNFKPASTGSAVKIDQLTIRDANGRSVSDVELERGGTYTITFPVTLSDVNSIAATWRVGDGVEQYLPRLLDPTLAKGATGSNGYDLKDNAVVVRYTPLMSGLYDFTLYYTRNNDLYSQTKTLGVGGSYESGSSGCAAGFGLAGLAAVSVLFYAARRRK